MRRVALLALVGFVALSACKKKDSGPDSVDDVPVDETISMPGLSGPVDIVRDEWGRPHIYGETDADFARAIGYIMARDRMLQMDFMRRFASGTVAELAGGFDSELVETDYLLRVLRLRITAQEIWNGYDANEPTRVLLEAYSEGVNLFIERMKAGDERVPVEYTFLAYPIADFPAWSPVDTLAIGRLMAMDQSFFGDIKASYFAQRAAADAAFVGTPREDIFCDLFRFQAAVDGSILDPNAPRTELGNCIFESITTSRPVSPQQAAAIRLASKRILEHPFNLMWAEDAGSNNWVVSGAHTASGAPMLANDPHLGLSAPSIWYQLHMNTLRGDGQANALGVALPGVPNILIGHNGFVGWGITNMIPDVTDNYVETFSIGTGLNGVDQVLHDPDGAGPMAAAFVDLVARSETLQVRDSTGITEQVRTVWELPHRPGAIIPDTLVENPPGSGNWTALSWRWTGFEATVESQAFYRLLRATNAADVQAARDFGGTPPTSLVYVTRDGDIGWDGNALYPIRDDDDGDPYTDPLAAPLPGDGSHEWIGYVARDEVPQDFNPPRGWLQTANQDPLGQTLDNDPLDDPIYIGPTYAIGFRGARISDLLDEGVAAGGLTPADMMRIQNDHQSPLGQRLTPFILTAAGGNGTYSNVVTLLQGWRDRGFRASAGTGPAEEDANAAADSAATMLFNVWLGYFTERVLGDELAVIGWPSDLPNSNQFLTRSILFLLEHPDLTKTYDGTDSVLFDDLNTAGTTETRQFQILGALDDALAWLASAEGFGSSNSADWTWGTHHTLRLESLLGVESLNIPSANDPDYPDGFPRQGDNFSVDVANWGVRGQSFNYGSGASMRMIIEAVDGDFRTWMAFPGGVSADAASVRYDDQVIPYVKNEHPMFWYHEKDVVRHATYRITLEP